MFVPLGDELFNSAFPVKKINDFIWEVDGKMIQIKDGIDDALIGANPSSEEAGEGIEDGVQTVIDIVHANQLEESPFGSKKEYSGCLKDYLKRVKERVAKENPELQDQFMAAVQKYWKEKILDNFKDWQFYRPVNYEAECQYFVPCNFREDGITPYFVFIAHGLEEEKC